MVLRSWLVSCLALLLCGASRAEPAALQTNGPSAPAMSSSQQADVPATAASSASVPAPAEPLKIWTKTVGKPIAIKRGVRVWVDWKDSVLLGKRLEALLISKGLQVASSKEEADGVLRIQASAALSGGPKLGKKSVNINISKVVDDTQSASAIPVEGGKVASNFTPLGLAMDAAATSTWMNQAVSPLMRGFGIQSFLMGVVEASGFNSWLNTKMGMDPRGICLGKCENWHKMQQAALLIVDFKEASGTSHVHVRSGTDAVEPVLDQLLNEVLLLLDAAIVAKEEVASEKR